MENIDRYYSDPLMPLILMDYEAREKLPNLIEIHHKKSNRMVMNGAFEADAWGKWVDCIRHGQKPHEIEARVRLVARMILLGTQRTTTMHGSNVKMETIDAAVRMAEFIGGEEWRNAVVLAKAILASDFAGCEHEVEV